MKAPGHEETVSVALMKSSVVAVMTVSGQQQADVSVVVVGRRVEKRDKVGRIG